MGSKKKKGSKASVDSRVEAAQPVGKDMSKYARAYSNKSKINYAELKLVRPGQTKTSDSSEGGRTEKKQKRTGAPGNGKAAKKNVEKENKVKKSAKKSSKEKKVKKDVAGGAKSVATEKAVNTPGMTAEERYSSALGREDHYSSAVEKYYLKYPDAKRPDKPSVPRRASDTPKKKKRRSSAEATSGQGKRSIAEIAARNKGTTSVRKHARAAEKAKARGVISPKVANRPFFPRKRKRSGALNVLMITVLLVFLASVGVTVFFNVKAVRVTGDNPYGEAKIKKICSIRQGSNILFLSTDEMERKVEKELPYISECTVQRKLPSSVVISVKKADVLGAIQTSPGQWSVLSTEGKILETVTNQTGTTEGDQSDAVTYTPEFSTVEEFAESRKISLLTGIDVDDDGNGHITDEKQLTCIRLFADIEKAFASHKMKLSSISFSGRGYEADYDGRITIVFGKEIDAKTISHRLDEVHALIFDKGYIAENEMGEIKFNGSSVYFRQAYEVSEEDVQRIHEQRRENNRKQLFEMAEIFMKTGDDWVNGGIQME